MAAKILLVSRDLVDSGVEQLALREAGADCGVAETASEFSTYGVEQPVGGGTDFGVAEMVSELRISECGVLATISDISSSHVA